LQTQWHFVCPLDAFPAEGKLAAVIAGWHVILVREGEVLFAFNDRCPHQGATLSPGKLRRGAIICPLHGARFKVDTGECIGEAYLPLRVFAVRVEDGAVLVALPEAAPGAGDLPVPGAA
jgi:nitrite reductase/ring-hydroxylating ferredoxin subunit